MASNIFAKDCEYLSRPDAKTGFKIKFNLAAGTARLTGALNTPCTGYTYRLEKNTKTDDTSLHLTLITVPPKKIGLCTENGTPVDEIFHIPQSITEIFIHSVEESRTEYGWDQDWDWGNWNGEDELPVPPKQEESLSLAMYCKIKP